jgi:hypothetical protein
MHDEYSLRTTKLRNSRPRINLKVSTTPYFGLIELPFAEERQDGSDRLLERNFLERTSFSGGMLVHRSYYCAAQLC